MFMGLPHEMKGAKNLLPCYSKMAWVKWAVVRNSSTQALHRDSHAGIARGSVSCEPTRLTMKTVFFGILTKPLHFLWLPLFEICRTSDEYYAGWILFSQTARLFYLTSHFSQLI
jgi:hypothetical protein